MSKPRAYTVDEMRQKVLHQLDVITRHWATTDLTRPEFRASVAAKGETLYRLEGLVFSMLVMLDGGTLDIPAIDLVPSPATGDAEFLREEGENWWPSDTVINDCQLHELWSRR